MCIFIRKHTEKIKVYLFLLLVLISSIMPLKVFAIDMDFYSSNDILFFNPDCTSSSSGSSSGSGSGEISGEIADNQNAEPIMKFIVSKGFTLKQAAGIGGNFMRESHLDPTMIEGMTHADASFVPQKGQGFGLAQWTYYTRQDKMVAYSKETSRSLIDLSFQLDWFWKEFTTDYLGGIPTLSQTTTIEDATVDFHQKYESSADGASQIQDRINYANQLYERFKSTIKDGDPSLLQSITSDASTSSVGSSSNCGSANSDIVAGVVAGDIIKTAKNLAWPTTVSEGTNQESQATPAFQAAKKQYNPSPPWTDCGGFVSTVLRSSGIDPSYKDNYIPTQITDIKSRPDKFLFKENVSRADIQPGDILFLGGDNHTMIYTGDQEYPAVDASLSEGDDGRIPSAVGTAALEYNLSREGGTSLARIIK